MLADLPVDVIVINNKILNPFLKPVDEDEGRHQDAVGTVRELANPCLANKMYA